MAGFYVYHVIRQPDKEVFEGIRACIMEAKCSVQKLTVDYITARENDTDVNLGENDEFKKVLELNEVAILKFAFHLAENLTISLERVQDKNTFRHHDLLRVASKDNQSPPVSKSAVLASNLRRRFAPSDLRAVFDHLTDDAKEYLQMRHEELAKINQMQREFFEEIRRFEKDYLAAVEQKKAELEAEHKARLQECAVDHEAKLKDLQAREEALDRRLKEVENRDSKHQRRQIRKDLLAEIKSLSTSFELTQKTRRLRYAVHVISILLLVLFGGAIAAFGVHDYKEGETFNPWIIIRQAVLGLGFGGVATFYVRYNAAWSQRHADEEFRLKRLALDIDRANWLVEMGLEWRKETGQEIPIEMLKQLAKNIFEEEGSEPTQLTPIEAISAMISSGATVKVGGSEIEIDKKTRKKAGKKPE